MTDTRETGDLARRYSAMMELLRARLLEFIREPAAVFWVYIFPLLMVVALGMAFRNRPIESIKVDIQEGPQAQAILDHLAGDERIEAQISSEKDARRRLRIGSTDLIAVGQDSSDQVIYIFDPTRPGSVLARNTADDVLQRSRGRKDVITSKDQEFDEPGGRYIDFLVPGLLGIGLMGGGMWGVGFAIVDMRIRKQLKRFLATPMKRSDFLMAMTLSRFVFMVPEVVILLAFSYIFFGVVIHGSVLAVLLIIILGALEFAGIGLLVASRASTLETVSGLMNLVMLPMWLASGMFFSTDRFPDAAQPVIQLLPLTPLISALRAVMLEGATLASQGTELVIIVLWGIGTFLLALKIFRWS